MKNEEAYRLYKIISGNYYNNVTVKEENNGIIITYQKAIIDNDYKNEIYNSEVDEMMPLKIKSNEEISSFELLNS